MDRRFPAIRAQIYVPRMEWVGLRGEIVLQQMNRLQNTIDVWLADAATGKARKMLHDEDGAWLDVVDSWQWLPATRAPLGQRAPRLAARLRRAAGRRELATPDAGRVRRR